MIQPRPRILLIGATERADDDAARLCGAVLRLLAMSDATVTRLSLEDLGLPLFDADRPLRGPDGDRLARLAGQVRAHRAILLVVPEVAAAPPPALTSLLLHLAGAAGPGETLLAGRTLALACATTRPQAGAAALSALRSMLGVGLGATLCGEDLVVSGGSRSFSADGGLRDAQDAARLSALVMELSAEAARWAE